MWSGGSLLPACESVPMQVMDARLPTCLHGCLAPDCHCRRLVCVVEDHSVEGQEAVTTVGAVGACLLPSAACCSACCSAWTVPYCTALYCQCTVLHCAALDSGQSRKAELHVLP